MREPRNLAARAGRWSARHRRAAILGWLLFVVLASGIGSAIGMRTTSDDTGPGESGRADRALDHAFNENDHESVLVQSRHGSSREREFASGVRDLVQLLRATGVAVHVESPFASGNEEQISKDGRTVVVDMQVKGTREGATPPVPDPVSRLLEATAAAADRHPSLRMEEIGEISAERAVDDAMQKDLTRAETLSVPLTLLILIVAFGALAAAGIPVVLALTAVLATTGLASMVSHIAAVDEAISNLILLIGMAVGVDYSLFYLRRQREERAAGRSSTAAVEAAAATSGHSVVVSGLTVMVAMAGMYFAGDPTFQSFATGTILVVAVAMVGSLTVLPALLSRLGDKVMKGRVPFIARRRDSGAESRVWAAVLNPVLRRPALAALLATAALVALAVPALGLKTGSAAEQSLPRGLPVTETLKRMDQAFPGGSSPAVVAVEARNVRAAAVRHGIHKLERLAHRSGDFPGRAEVTVAPSGRLAAVALPIAGNGTDERSKAALEKLRGELIPRSLGRVDGVRASVTGTTAGSVDFSSTMMSRAPVVFGFVVVMAFLLLMVTFRSIVIPLKAIALNLLSVGAAYGVLVLVFQHGWGASLLGFETPGVIESWLPVFLFVVLFGLSMDYHVFILSRIREAFAGGMSMDEAVAHGIRSTAAVVTSAALVMVAVFGVFASLSALLFKELGVGLAAAILIDATIVRAVLLPAAMKLLGERNWYLPRCLECLPRVGERAVT